MAFDLLWLAIVFFIVAAIMYALGARGTAYFTEGIGRILIWVFLVLFIITLLFRLLR
jgi:uncharacterized membrane protein YtjA (UPF0391 family)